MSCRHIGNKLEFGVECKILRNGRCRFLVPDEDRCSKEPGAVIKFLKALNVYDDKVKHNPEYNSTSSKD